MDQFRKKTERNWNENMGPNEGRTGTKQNIKQNGIVTGTKKRTEYGTVLKKRTNIEQKLIFNF